MNAKDYELLMKTINKVVDKCNNLITQFNSSEAILKWTVGEYQDNCLLARELQTQTDQILHNDLYHIIGMGNLSPAQTAKFLVKIKELGDSRSKLKALASLNSIVVPGVPTKAEYKCTLLNNKKLTKDVK